MLSIKNKKALISIAAIAIMCAVFSAYNPIFFSLSNIISIYREAALVGFLAVGMSFVLGCGETDLSCGSIVAVMVVLAGRLLEDTRLPLVLTVFITIAVAVGFELINFALIRYLHISSFIATLAMSNVYSGLRYFIAFQENGIAISKTLTNKSIRILAGKCGDIYYSILALLVVILIAQIIQKKTRFGNYIYALGSNKKAAVLSGVNEGKVKASVFVIMGIMCGISGIFMLARLGSATVNISDGMEFLSIASVVIGGASIWVYGATGGVSDAVGAFIGITFMYVLRNGLMKVNVDSSYISMLQGAGLLLIMTSDLIIAVLTAKSKEKKNRRKETMEG